MPPPRNPEPTDYWIRAAFKESLKYGGWDGPKTVHALRDKATTLYRLGIKWESAGVIVAEYFRANRYIKDLQAQVRGLGEEPVPPPSSAPQQHHPKPQRSEQEILKQQIESLQDMVATLAKEVGQAKAATGTAREETKALASTPIAKTDVERSAPPAKGSRKLPAFADSSDRSLPKAPARGQMTIRKATDDITEILADDPRDL